MGEFMLYLVKAAICLAVFSLFFRLLLMKETFFRFTRFMLLVGLVVCSIIPLVKIGINHSSMIQKPVAQLERMFIPSGNTEGSDMLRMDEVKGTNEKAILASISPVSARLRPDDLSVKYNVSSAGMTPAEKQMADVEKIVVDKKTIPVVTILFAIYLLGVLAMCVRLAISLWRLWHIIRNNRVTLQGGYRLIICRNAVTPFSYFNYIVLSEADYHSNAKEIILHEQMHIKYRHHLDILFSELFLVVHWFNPAVWSLYEDLREIHEYESDSAVIEQGIDARDYQLLLVKKAVGEKRFTAAINSFNQSKIKNRIAMMLRKESKAWARLKLLFVVPFTAVLLLAFAKPENDLSITYATEQISGPGNIVKQVQDNPFFYWDEVRQYCKGKGIQPVDLNVESETNRHRRVIMLINAQNQIMYLNHASKEVIKNPDEGNSTVSEQTLKKIITEVMKSNDPEPLYYFFQYDKSTSTRFLFNFLYSTLPAAYEAALEEVSERDGIAVERLRKEKPLLLLYQIPREFDGKDNQTDSHKDLKDRTAYIHSSIVGDAGGKRNIELNYAFGKKNEGILTVSINQEYIPNQSGNDSIRQELVTNISALDHNSIAFVALDTNITPSDIETIQKNLFEVKKSIFTMVIR